MKIILMMMVKESEEKYIYICIFIRIYEELFDGLTINEMVGIIIIMKTRDHLLLLDYIKIY